MFNYSTMETNHISAGTTIVLTLAEKLKKLSRQLHYGPHDHNTSMRHPNIAHQVHSLTDTCIQVCITHTSPHCCPDFLQLLVLNLGVVIACRELTSCWHRLLIESEWLHDQLTVMKLLKALPMSEPLVGIHG